MLAAKISDHVPPAVFAVDYRIIVRIGCACIKSFADQTVEHDINAIRCAVTDVCKCAAGSIKIYDQIVEMLIIGFS